MEKFRICGPSKLFGEISIGGAKNAALPILCASLLTSESVEVFNVPNLRDVSTMFALLRKLGVKVNFDSSESRCQIRAESLLSSEASYDLVKTMRASILVLGPLLARFGEAKVSLPGGCAIGQRPVDQHIKGLRLLGAQIELENGYIKAKAKKLVGTNITNEVVTVTGTENLMMASTLAEGITVIENAAQEPEIIDLANFLRSMGANIVGDGTNTIEIEGKKRLTSTAHNIISDRIEAGTYMCAVAACGGDVYIKNIDSSYMGMTLQKLNECGGKITEDKKGIRVKFSGKPKPVNFQTAPFPGFPTDMQAQFMAVNSIAEGTSIIKECIFENRFMHVPELKRMGAKIEIHNNIAHVYGPCYLNGAEVMATDLRASVSLVLAALIAEKRTKINRIYHLDRGYQDLEKKLIKCRASIKRV